MLIVNQFFCCSVVDAEYFVRLYSHSCLCLQQNLLVIFLLWPSQCCSCGSYFFLQTVALFWKCIRPREPMQTLTYCMWTEWLKHYFGDTNICKMVKEHCLYFKWAMVNSQLLGKSDDRAVTDSGGREEVQGAACTLRRAVWQHWRHGAVCWGESCVFVQVLEMRLRDVNVSVASVFL